MLKSVDEYNRVVDRIRKLMTAEKSENEVKELQRLLDQVDSFDGMKFLKVRAVQQQ